MSFINKIPRGLRVLAVIVILGILIWQFAVGTHYYYYCIGAAVLVTFGVILLVYKPFKSTNSSLTPRKSGVKKAEVGPNSDSGEDAAFDTVDIEADFTDTPPASRAQANRPLTGNPAKPAAPQTVRSSAQSARPASGESRLSAKPSVADVARNQLQAKRAGTIDDRQTGKATAFDEKAESMASVQADLKDEKPSAKPIPTDTGKASFMSKIPRGLRVLAVMTAAAVLVWQFAQNTSYFYYSIGAAVLVTFGVILLVYKPFKSSPTDSKPGASKSAESQSGALPETIAVESDYTDTPSIMRNKPVTPFRETVSKTVRPSAAEAGRNLHATTRQVWPLSSPATGKTAMDKTTEVESELETDQAAAVASEKDTAAPSIPLVEDETTLTEEDKNQLVNAVWYRCENPYCKYTSFLGVHHIVEEKEGGTNRLDNLIVLCPYCHDLAHRGEIPVEEMRDWISNRENRFKFKPDWKYF